MTIEFTVDKPQDWLKHIADQFGVELVDHTIHFPDKLGEGFLRHYYLTNGLTLNYLRFRFHTDIVFSRKAGQPVPFSPIMFYINEARLEQEIQGEFREINRDSPNGVFWPSSHISSIWRFPLKQWISNITIAVNHNWLLENCRELTGNYVHGLLAEEKPFYVFEEMTPEMERIINEIAGVVDKDAHASVSGLILESKTTELLAVFLEKLIDRPLEESSSRLSSSDVKKLFQVKSLLLQDLSSTPKLKDLAALAGFSESKLQKKFRQVFGKSISQFALQEKMALAGRMLGSRKYSVSEVGYELGYSNLSHFTKAFRNQFGINPKAFSSRKH